MMRRERKNSGVTHRQQAPAASKPSDRCVYCGRTGEDAEELFPTETGFICGKCIYRIAQHIKTDIKQNQAEGRGTLLSVAHERSPTTTDKNGCCAGIQKEKHQKR